MSHFACSVFHRVDESPEAILEPYSYDAYEFFEREIYMTKEEYITNYKTWHPETTLDDAEIWETRHEEYNDTDEEYIYNSCNPNGHFDWCREGGRYADSLKIRKTIANPNTVAIITGYDNNRIHINRTIYDAPPFRFCTEWDQSKNRYYTVYRAPIKDVLWNKMNNNKTKINKLKKNWEQNENLRLRYKDINEYIIINTMFNTYAYYDSPSGDWVSVEDFNSDKEYIQQYMAMINMYKYIDDMCITIVDCHT